MGPSPFPAGFLIGAATSAHQVEGGNRGNDWSVWEEQGRVPERSGLCCDHYRRFREDLELARRLEHNAYRFSMEWSRVEPAPGEFSEEALAHYEQVVETCRAKGLEPVVTLHHFTNPRWFAAQGGWLSPQAPKLFARYAGEAAGRMGSRVRWWVTINEPTVLAYYGYITGIWPPGRRSIPEAVRVLRQMAAAHRLAYQALHASSPDCFSCVRVGIAHHLRCYEPCRPGSWKDRWAARFRGWAANDWPLEQCRGAMDFIGVNYYSRDFIRWGGWRPAGWLGQVCAEGHHPGRGPVNALGWEIYPQGLGILLRRLVRWEKPLLVAENGVCVPDDGARWRFIEDHLSQVEKALARKIPVAGYLYWSLLDNFEWAQGFAPRFGLVEVDYATQERRPRPSAQRLARWIRDNIKGGREGA